MSVCHFCFNAHVWHNLPKTDEELYDTDPLTDDNDGSSSCIGTGDVKHRISFNSGMGRACEIEVCEWSDIIGWNLVAMYYPKYCPECGRKLDEYMISDRGTSFTKRKEE
jgi:hypothetical protein